MNRWMKNIFAAVLILAAGFLIGDMRAEAEGETSRFGSESYEWAQGTESPIGVYVESDDPMYYVDMQVHYDPAVLEYRSGGELESEGTVRVSSGAGQSRQFSMMLYFVPVATGDTNITIDNVTVQYSSGDTSTAATASVQVSIPIAEGCGLKSLAVNGQPVQSFSRDVTSYTLDVDGTVTDANIEATAEDTSSTVSVSDTVLAVGENVITVTTTNQSGNKAVYTLTVNRSEPEAITQTEEETPAADGVQVIREGNAQQGNRMRIILAVSLVVLIIVLILLIAVLVRMAHNKKKRRHRQMQAKHLKGAKNRQQRKNKKHLNTSNRSERKRKVSEKPTVQEIISEEEDGREVEIDVKNVSMEFKREKDEATSIKELLIRTIKGQRSYEMFKALDDVSFTVHKGEVVGIIGTNGSGKSTILKIISGVLTPTEGKVDVDKSKIQLLTLGTGFDFELTGRENVYLNGAVIGYTKEFIDEKYDDIVKFAELEGFMEEKVRNYSSGMVSRLGFAIATIRDTPEILILDEVLSVGDMFFRQKSEKRIKEMMHGGSTVLIVSHSTSVIRNNCTKAVWIEKGKLRAVGNPTEVCTAYEKMNQNG